MLLSLRSWTGTDGALRRAAPTHQRAARSAARHATRMAPPATPSSHQWLAVTTTSSDIATGCSTASQRHLLRAVVTTT